MADPIKTVSILETVKKLLGLAKTYVSFDSDVLIHINTVFSNLTQMGVGPVEGFTIEGYEETWDSYLTVSDKLKMQQLKSYIYLKVKYLFDPPTNANVSEAMKNSIDELEFRLRIEEENTSYIPPVVEEEDVVMSEEDI